MPLPVVSFCTYLTSIGVAWRGIDHDTHDFIDAIKDRDINKWSSFRVKKGDWRRFDNANRQDVVLKMLRSWSRSISGIVPRPDMTMSSA